MNAGTDWNEVWMETQKRHTASGRGGECWCAWRDEADARDYLAMSRKRPAARDRMEDLCSLVRPGWRVLDIGAGPGNIAIPLAGKAAHVTAAEPAPGMAAVLKEQIRDQGINNITVVNKKWDDIDPAADLSPPYDLSFASFSLGMLDLRSSIEKMMTVTAGKIVLFWHAGHQAWDRDSLVLWPLLHGRNFEPIPKSDIVFNLLYSMGIYPDIRVIRSRTEIVYDSFADALEQFARRYDAGDEAKKALLADYLNEKLISRDGKTILPRSDAGMRISWNTEEYHAL